MAFFTEGRGMRRVRVIWSRVWPSWSCWKMASRLGEGRWSWRERARLRGVVYQVGFGTSWPKSRPRVRWAMISFQPRLLGREGVVDFADGFFAGGAEPAEADEL